MKPVYEIKFLSNKDFDELPKKETNGSDISDSLGFYNPFTNRVFIRHTAIPELDKYLLEHEFEHLIEDSPTDSDENGIRHKKGKKFFKQILAPLFTGFNLETGKFSPFGILGDTNQKDQSQQAQEQSPLSGFGNLGFGLSGSGESSPTYGSSFNPTSGQQSSQSGLNQGLNQQTVNPLANPYAKYGQPAGRILNF